MTTKKNDTSLVLRPNRGGGELAKHHLTLHPNPYAEMYLSGLRSEDSRPAQRSALNACARIMTGLDETIVDLHNFPWMVLTVIHLRTLKAKLVEVPYAPRSINRMMAAVKGVLKVAWEADAISTDQYTRAISVPGESTSSLEPAGRWVPRDEIERLLDAARAQPEPRAFRDQALVVMLYGSGLRRQEASAMDVANYRDKDGEVKVVKGKRGKFRTTYLNEGYRPWVIPWLKFQRERGSEPLFCRWHRNGPGTARLSEMGVDHVLDRLCVAAKIPPVTPHDLRRSFASELLDAEADILMVQELMGHANVATTKIYDRRGEKGKRKAIERFPVIAYR